MNNVFRDREILTNAHERGAASTLGAFFRLSGPGWLQAAITLGGASLGGALYLGMLGGTSMLWLQLVAIVIGVIMLSAISYVTLSTGKRPYAAINEYVNPVLGVGWITATILANMIWILPQFALCYDVLDTNLTSGLGDSTQTRAIVSGVIGAAALFVVLMSFSPGWMSKIFNLILKLVVAFVVICFILVFYQLATNGNIDWNEVLLGFIPNLNHWTTAAPDVQTILNDMPGESSRFWKEKIINKQQEIMVGVTATAVGLNMTFLLPYSMLARGWDKPFRGLAKFDLITAMAIPYLIVTTCIVIASAHAFHAKADEAFLNSDAEVIKTSVLFKSTLPVLEERYKDAKGSDAAAAMKDLGDEEKAEQLALFAAGLSEAERRLAPTLIKPNTSQLSTTLAPLLGERYAKLIFGLGAFAMGFSTILILMLINAYAFAEIVGHFESSFARAIGAFAACATGFCWFLLWTTGSKTWLIIVAGTFGAILLPIAYIAFFALMNSSRLLGAEKPRGFRMTIWNLLMTIGVLGAGLQAWGATRIQLEKPEGGIVLGGLVTFCLLALIGFSARFRRNESETKLD